MKPDKYALARCGFVYTGTGDRVVCYKCGILLKEWERTDDPWREHVKWNPRCDFILRVGWTQGWDEPDELEMNI